MSQGNKREPSHDGGGEAKRLKSALEALNTIANEYVCPITMELPEDIVTAEDGRAYERWAIEDHIERQGDNLRSPVTNEPMGPRLLPNIQARNMIEQLVKSGAISGDKARRWEERIETEKRVASLKEKAEHGDPEAMNDLGDIFFLGELCGVKQDRAKAFEWHKQASDKNYVPGIASVGQSLVLGVGTTKNVVGGMILIVQAAERGSGFAAYNLGWWYAEGCHTVPKDKDRAKEWLQKAISGSGDFAFDLHEDDKNDARDLFNELVGGEGE